MNGISLLRRWAGLAVLLFLVAGCDDTEVAAAPQATTIQVSPSGVVDLFVGDRLQVSAAVQAAPAGAVVTFTSSDARIAAVDGAGVVTALSPGIATVTAEVQGSQGPVRATLSVRVAARALPADTARSSIRIGAVVDPATGIPVDRAAVSGPVAVRIEFTPGRATRLEALAGDSVFCSQSFAAPASSAPAVANCPFDTARFDSISGRAAFPNGPLPLRARLVGPGDTIRVASDPLSLVLANRNRLFGRISSERQAPDTLGLAWSDGDLTVTAMPVLYSPGTPLSRVQFAYRTPSGDTLVSTDEAAPFSAVFREEVEPAAGGLRGVTDAALRFTLASTLQGGQAGLQATTPAVRYDNQPPRPGGLRGRDWIGAATRFADLYDERTQRDAGVGRVTARFFAGSPNAEASQIIAAGGPVETGSDLREARVGSYRLAAQVCDALENCVAVLGFNFGVDLGVPTVTSTGLPDRALNPTEGFSVGVEDDLSGFGSRYLQATVTLLDSDPATPACGPRVDGIDLPGRAVGGACLPDTVDVLRTPEETPGYYTYRIAAVDQAGNVGEPVVRTLLIDPEAPTIEQVSIPTELTAGRDVVVRVEANDNLDLARVSAALVYRRPAGGTLGVPFVRADSAGVPFDEQLVTRRVATLTFPYIATLTFAESGRLADARTVGVDSLRVRAEDVAGLATSAGFRVPAGSISAVSPFASLETTEAELSFQVVCTADCIATDPTSTTLTVRLAGPTGARNPLERVYFFVQRADGVVRLVGSTTAATIREAAQRRTVSYSFAYQPPAGTEGEFVLFAVGVTATGNGVKIGEESLRLLTR